MQNKFGIHFKVKGLVQGVWFRASTQDEAKALNLMGWVKNTMDGGVEGKAFGEKEPLDQLSEWLKIGPPAARVDALDIEEIPWEEYDRFYIKKTPQV